MDDLHMDEPDHLEPTAAERRVLAAVRRGQVARLAAMEGAAARCVRASFLRALLTGRHHDWQVAPEGVRLDGATIEGSLNLLDVRSPSGLALPALSFHNCRFEQPVTVMGASFRSLTFSGCLLPRLDASGLRLEADLDLTGSIIGQPPTPVTDCSRHCVAVDLDRATIGGRLILSSSRSTRFTAHGMICLVGARIGSDVLLKGSHINGFTGIALTAGGAAIDGDVTFDSAHGHRCEVSGEIRLAAAEIKGDLSVRNARLSHSEGRAVHAEDIVVESVFITGESGDCVEIEGRLNFLSATVGGNFVLSGARLAPGPDYEGTLALGGPICLNLQQARISNALILLDNGALAGHAGGGAESETATRQDVEGWFVLTDARIGSIADDPETGWPAPGFLEIDGLTYGHLRARKKGDEAETRLLWLKRQYRHGIPEALTFRPQPYEELARMFREHGRAVEADRVAVEKIRMRLRAKVDNRWARFLPALLMLISHHGYSSSRAILTSIAFILAGSFFYALALWGFEQPFVPVELAPVPTRYTLVAGLIETRHAAGCPGFALPHYALDVALPVVDLGQASVCRFAPQGRAMWLWLFLHSLYAMFGAALSATVVLTLTGVLRRD